jgi:hypothetical protein
MKKTGLFLPLRNLSVSALIAEGGAGTGTGTAGHNRRLQNLTVQGQVVQIKLALNRWQCRHRKCGRRTFTVRIPKNTDRQFQKVATSFMG